MGDPLSTIAGVVGVTEVAIEGVHAFLDLINGLKEAPNTIAKCKDDLDNVEGVLVSLKRELEKDNASDAWSEIIKNTQLGKAVRTLGNNCDTFQASLAKWTKHSVSGSKFSKRDRFSVTWHERKIELLSTQLNSYKLTVTLAMGICTVQGQAEMASKQDEAVKQLSALTLETNKLTDLSKTLKTARDDAEENNESGEVLEAVRHEYDAVLRTKKALTELQSVGDYVAKATGAENVNMIIGEIIADESNNISAGLTNVERAVNLNYRQGNIKAGKNNTIQVGWHNDR